MTDREKLIEILKKPIYPKIGIDPAEVVADYLIDNGVIVPPETGIGDVSDGYHTFNELYHHRAVLFSVICNTFKDKAWKSKKHDTGDMYDGMFIVGIETPQGQATYHYDIDPYWDMFKVKELPKAPKWDGHTPEEAIRRISMLQTDNVIVPPCKVGEELYCVYSPPRPANPADKGKWYMDKFEVARFHYGVKGLSIEMYGYGTVNVTEIGKTVFFTREEAEEALQSYKKDTK